MSWQTSLLLSRVSARLPLSRLQDGPPPALAAGGSWVPPAQAHAGPGSQSKFPGGELGALDAGADLGERGVAASGDVITERGEAAVIAGAQPARFDVGGGYQHPVPDLFGRLYPRVDRV